jgi:hypothetical protein
LGVKIAATPAALSLSASSFGMTPPAITGNVVVLGAAALDDLGDQGPAGARQDREPYAVGVLVHRGPHDMGWREADAFVDDLHADGPQYPPNTSRNTCDHSPVVAPASAAATDAGMRFSSCRGQEAHRHLETAPCEPRAL